MKKSTNRRGGGSWAAIALLGLAIGAPASVSAGQDAAGNGFTSAIESNTVVPDMTPDREPGDGGEGSVEVSASPYWCNGTAALVDDIHRRGGESVMRMELGRGRVIERYWNATEEVTIEHGNDGESCLLELKSRRAER